jgi:hypothetical protein
VRDTPCWPARWKVTFDWQGRDWGSNETHHYFRDRAAAEAEAARRNAREAVRGGKQ